jgi:DNA-binding response OmpR family regulator
MKKILLCDDHTFYCQDIIEYLREINYEVHYVPTYKQADALLQTNSYDFSLLDIILQNGKTGFNLAEKYENKLGKIMFITGCVDRSTLEILQNSKHASASKGIVIWETLNIFLAGGTPKII